MSLVRWTEPHFKSDQVAVASQRHLRRKSKKDRLDDAYKAVDERDKGICWVTGRHTEKNGTDARTAREHHHLRGRNVMPEWKYDSDRIITVTREAHQLITPGKIDVEGDDARRKIFFHWNCKPKERPFEIQPKWKKRKGVAVKKDV